jgi:hypothetical protein
VRRCRTRRTDAPSPPPPLAGQIRERDSRSPVGPISAERASPRPSRSANAPNASNPTWATTPSPPASILTRRVLLPFICVGALPQGDPRCVATPRMPCWVSCERSHRWTSGIVARAVPYLSAREQQSAGTSREDEARTPWRRCLQQDSGRDGRARSGAVTLTRPEVDRQRRELCDPTCAVLRVRSLETVRTFSTPSRRRLRRRDAARPTRRLRRRRPGSMSSGFSTMSHRPCAMLVR